MIKIALYIGLYSYLIFLIGISGNISHNFLLLISLIYFFIILLDLLRNKIYLLGIKLLLQDNKVLFLLFFIMFLINFIGALGPEHGFDALWYHLEIPKIYLLEEKILFIPGGLLYYSAMPKLIEHVFLGLIYFQGEESVKVLNFLFGILCVFATYKISRLFVSERLSILSSLIFYSNLVVGWESITGYIDLGRTFFESVSFFVFFLLLNKSTKVNKFVFALSAGLLVSNKYLSYSSILIFLVIYVFWNIFLEKKYFLLIKDLFFMMTIFFLTILPWNLFSYIHTNNPFYPFFSSIYEINPSSFSLNSLALDLFGIFVFSDDPISPIYIIFFPFIFFIRKYSRTEKILAAYCLLSILFWYFTPRTGGGRFIMPYLPLFSVFCVVLLSKIEKNFRSIANACVLLVYFISFVFVLYRGAANIKYLQYFLDGQNKKEFLSKNLNFNYGDFYDIDGFFDKNLKDDDVVLLYGFHNLYYVDFKYIHESWVVKGDRFNFIAAQKTSIPDRFRDWRLVYNNNLTGVKLYKTDGFYVY